MAPAARRSSSPPRHATTPQTTPRQIMNMMAVTAAKPPSRKGHRHGAGAKPAPAVVRSIGDQKSEAGAGAPPPTFASRNLRAFHQRERCTCPGGTFRIVRLVGSAKGHRNTEMVPHL